MPRYKQGKRCQWHDQHLMRSRAKEGSVNNRCHLHTLIQGHAPRSAPIGPICKRQATLQHAGNIATAQNSTPERWCLLTIRRATRKAKEHQQMILTRDPTEKGRTHHPNATLRSVLSEGGRNNNCKSIKREQLPEFRPGRSVQRKTYLILHPQLSLTEGSASNQTRSVAHGRPQL